MAAVAAIQVSYHHIFEWFTQSIQTNNKQFRQFTKINAMPATDALPAGVGPQVCVTYTHTLPNCLRIDCVGCWATKQSCLLFRLFYKCSRPVKMSNYG